MSGSHHLDRVSNVKIGIECQIFVIVIFFNCDQVLQFGAYLRYYRGNCSFTGKFLLLLKYRVHDYREINSKVNRV